MLTAIPDMKMLRSFCAITLGDKADDFLLPEEKDKLIVATVAGMRAADGLKPANGSAQTVQAS
jgi:hypothetical protein